MNNRLFCLVPLLLMTVCLVHAQAYRQLSGKVSFSIKNAGITVDGYFKDAPAITLQKTQGNVDAYSLSGTLAVKGVNTGIGIRDKHLLRSDYFDEPNYPQISMTSQQIIVKGGKAESVFQLTIKGVSKTVSMPLTIAQAENEITFNGAFKINRRDFGVGGNSLTLSDEVTIQVAAGFVKQ